MSSRLHHHRRSWQHQQAARCVKAIQRIYGEKARDFVDALKSNPVVAVPLVLKRLKAKDEEWREAKKTMEKVWREQIEKNYLRSLDHCAAPFKQNDQKHLKAKSLVNEIETIYYERVEAKEEEEEQQQQQTPPSDRPTIQHNEPHLVFRYEDKSILEDAAALIIHHVKRQTAIQKEDKQKIKQIVYHFLPDLFFISRGALSDDESSEAPPPPPPPPKPQQQTSSGSDSLADESGKKLRSNVASMKSSTTQNNGLPNAASSSSAGSGNPPTTPTRHTDTNKRRLTDVDFDKIQREIPTEYKTPDDLYRLLYVDEHWYLFVRYHQILCERLYKIYKQAQHQAEQERAESRSREQSVADALKLRQKLDIAVDDFYPAFLDIVRNLLDNNMDSVQYEDTLREMFGIHAYIAFTLDKLVHNCVRQLQYLVQDDTSVAVKQLYHDEQRAAPNACGGKVSHMSHANVMAAELAYQKRAESLLNDQNVFKIISYKNSSRVTMELIDPQRDDEDDESNPDDIDVEKWSEYIEKYCSENSTANQQPQQPEKQTITDDLKSLLLKRPLFLTRNAHRLKCKFGVYKNKPATTTTTTTTSEKPSEETTQKTSDDTTAATTTTTTSITKAETNTTGEKEPGETAAVVAKKQPRYEPNETTCMYRRNGLKVARKSHHSVTKRMYDKFRKHTNKWLKENGLTADCIDDWLLGESSAANLAGTKTVCVKESIPKRTPYHVYYRYKVQSTVNNSSSKTDLTTLKKNASSASKLAENNSNNSNNGNNKKLKTQSSIDETTAAKSEPARTSPTPPQSQQQQE